jgi:chromosomal replication initiator protein
MNGNTFSIPLHLHKTSKGEKQVEQFLFPSFIGGTENRWVQQLFRQAETEGLASLSPVVLCGPPGTGKSALLMTIAASFAKESKTGQRKLIHGNDFSRELHSAIQTNSIDDFRETYRTNRLLIIDDLHEIATKEAAQEELISTLDAIESLGGAFVTSMPRLPANIRGFKPSLVSRLSAGFQVPIEPPGLEARFVLLNAFCKQLRLDITADWLEKIARELPNGLRVSQLRASLLKLVSPHTLGQKEPQEDALKDLIASQTKNANLGVADIAKAVAQHYQIKLADLRGTTRKSNLVRMRGLAMHLCRQLTSLSLQQIGHYFGGRDHSTVLHACRKTETDILTDPELSKAFEDILNAFSQRS